MSSMYRGIIAILFFSFLKLTAFGQEEPVDSSVANKFLKWNIIGQSALAVGSTIAFNEAWYAGYERSPLHSFDDSREWLQMDKLGHVVGAYRTAKYLSYSWRWSGLSKNKSDDISTLTSIGYLTMIEILDGTSAQWGFSWSDMGANLFGAALYWGQNRLWNYQRIRPKLSFHPTEYAQYRPELLGSHWSEQWLKDYNGQTYWYSFSPFIWGEKNIEHPFAWACISIGYGGRGMLGGHFNPEFNNAGEALPSFERRRYYYFSLDIDWTRVPVKWKYWNSVALVLNFFKMPLPTLELGNGSLNVKPLYY